MSPITELWLYTPQGPFQFLGAEVPEQITFGGAQMLCTHRMIGGLRIVDAMGADDAPLSWSGLFLYNGAAQRADFLNYIRSSGLQCKLTWGGRQYQVIVSEFKADYKYPFKIPFTITCEVVADETNPVSVPTDQSPTDAINQDSATATQMASNIGNSTISNLTGNVSSSLSAVTTTAHPIANGLVSLTDTPSVGEVGPISTLSASASSAISASAAPLAALQSGTQSMIATNNATIAAVPVLGQVIPGNPMAPQIAAIIAQCAAAVQMPSLYELSAVTSRMQANVALVADPAGTNQVVTGGGNLYQVAAQTYGDATRWTDIAAASGITDPMTTGFNTLTIPA